MSKFTFIAIVIFALIAVVLSREYASFDGRGNNKLHPNYGIAGAPLKRLGRNRYEDGKSIPRGGEFGEYLPSPRRISNELFGRLERGENPTNERRPKTTDIASFWGQFLDHDLSLTPNRKPCEEFPITIHSGDSHFNPDGSGRAFIPFCRSDFVSSSPREQVNKITSFIDASNVYGHNDEIASKLRTKKGGLLKSTFIKGEEFPPYNKGKHSHELIEMENPVKRMASTELFAIGDSRGNENPALAAIHTLFLREHNRIARSMRNSGKSDEEIFQTARRMVRAFIQKITFEEYLPSILGKKLPRYKGYNPHVDASIRTFFSSVAYRFGHDTINSIILRLNKDYVPVQPHGNILLRDSFFFPKALSEVGLDPVLRGLTVSLQGEVDANIIDDLRQELFAKHPNFALDLVALNIQRARDHGVPSYNEARKIYGLSPCRDYSCISKDKKVIKILENLYGKNGISKVDPFVGLLEEKSSNSNLGPLFSAAITEQMKSLRDGDRFWYERRGVLTKKELHEVRRTTFSDIIKRNTNIKRLPKDVFIVNSKFKLQIRDGYSF